MHGETVKLIRMCL